MTDTHPEIERKKRHHSLETIEKIKLHHRRHQTEETKKKLSAILKGKKKTEEHRRNMSLATKGIPKPDSVRWKLGRKASKETRRRMSESHRGSKGPGWRGGINPINDTIRKSIDYALWREAVFERDNYTCVWCGVRGGKLNADHIKPFCLFPELRFAIDNGRTLCKPCHQKTDTWGSKALKYNGK
jgi:hypothetical protein